MSKMGPAKYYTVHRPLTLQDLIAHLQGRKIVGALLRHPDRPMLEVSPAGRGDHLWIIYTDLIEATLAHRHLLQYAPMLSHIKEAWPGPGPNKVRLPGGRYVSPKVSAWCTLTDWGGALLAPQGHAAHLLLLDAARATEADCAFRA